MARVLVKQHSWGFVWEKAVDRVVSVPVAGVPATIDTDVWDAASGGSIIDPGDFITDADGYLPGYVEPGSYSLSVDGGAAVAVEAVNRTGLAIADLAPGIVCTNAPGTSDIAMYNAPMMVSLRATPGVDDYYAQYVFTDSSVDFTTGWSHSDPDADFYIGPNPTEVDFGGSQVIKMRMEFLGVSQFSNFGEWVLEINSASGVLGAAHIADAKSVESFREDDHVVMWWTIPPIYFDTITDYPTGAWLFYEGVNTFSPP